MNRYSGYVIPGLGALCVAGAIAVVIAARAPMDSGFALEDPESYGIRVPENLEPASNIPTMELVVEKHLFVKERKATGQNTFPDLLVKGIYVGEGSSAVFSLKYRPTANIRVWKGDVDSVIKNITNERDPRKPIVDFLSEWDIKEITFKGVTVEHIITGEVETYLVDYTPTKHVKDSAAGGYGQGSLAEVAQGNSGTVKTTKQQASKASQTGEQRAQAFSQLRGMVQQMTPEQRAKLAERIAGGGQRGQQQGGNTQQNDSRSNSSSSSESSSSNGGGSSRRGGGR